MARRPSIPPHTIADVVVSSRRRCCICFALTGDSGEKKGQVAHLDHDRTNNSLSNLVFLCLAHHDEFDSRTSQSKGLTIEEVRRYRSQLERFVAKSLPLSDSDVARALIANLDRPAFRTPFRQESSLPRFRDALAEAISAISTGRSVGGVQLPSKNEIRDPQIRGGLEAVVEGIVALRATFDELLREGEIEHCACGDADCPVHMLSDRATHEMDRRRHELLVLAQSIDPTFPAAFY